MSTETKPPTPAIAASDWDIHSRQDKELVQGLGLTSSTMLVMGSMIGSGIFIVSAEIGREVNSPALLIGAWLVTRFFTRNRYTRHDAPLSINRAYTVDELVDMAHEAGLRPVAHYRTRPGYRYALVFMAAAVDHG